MHARGLDERLGGGSLGESRSSERTEYPMSWHSPEIVFSPPGTCQGSDPKKCDPRLLRRWHCEHAYREAEIGPNENVLSGASLPRLSVS